MDLLKHIDNPKQLEQLYRNNKSAFKTAFNLIAPNITDPKLRAFWNERLNYNSSEISWGSRKDIGFVLIASVLAGLIAKIPTIFSLDQDLFFQRNIGFVVFPALTSYFIWSRGLPLKKIAFTSLLYLIALIYINVLPITEKSDTLNLACIHLPFLLWSLLGFSFVSGAYRNSSKILEYLRYNGDLIIMTGLILISGGLLTGITIGLFSVIGIQIEEFYFEYVGVFGLAAAPIVGTYLTQSNPQLVDKISPVIAKIFSPLVLIMLLIYLVAIIYSGKDPYNDRDFLLIFNALLIGVMAIILFSVSETSNQNKGPYSIYILLSLSIVTIIVNIIALSAILYRISEWGITPNRLAVLGGNFLMLIHLALITFQLFKQASMKGDIQGVERSIVVYLPVYILWGSIVTLLFPILFQFK